MQYDFGHRQMAEDLCARGNERFLRALERPRFPDISRDGPENPRYRSSFKRRPSMDWFKSERQKWTTKIHLAQLRSTPTLPGFDARSRELYGTALPRGVLLPRL